jgi:hypothetical protein
MHTPLEQASLADGESLSLGGLYWPRPYFPTRVERAALVAGAIPAWATPTGTTSAWIWTGFGVPTPLSVLRPSSPSLSPIERESWRARELREAHHHVTSVGGHPVLDPPSTEEELLRHAHNIDSAATQILFLRAIGFPTRSRSRLRMSDTQRDWAHQIQERVAQMESAYPDITR